jgi:hypothetical protein
MKHRLRRTLVRPYRYAAFACVVGFVAYGYRVQVSDTTGDAMKYLCWLPKEKSLMSSGSSGF